MVWPANGCRVCKCLLAAQGPQALGVGILGNDDCMRHRQESRLLTAELHVPDRLNGKLFRLISNFGFNLKACLDSLTRRTNTVYLCTGTLLAGLLSDPAEETSASRNVFRL